MTTIAYKDGILAADTQATIGDVKILSADKICILNEVTILASAGIDSSIVKVRRFFSHPNWEDLMAKEKVPELKKDYEGLLFYKGECYTVDKEITLDPIVHPYVAAGSGWQWAMAAMALGKTAIEAVEFAHEFDVFTNDKVRWINVTEFFKNAQGKTQRATRNRKRTERVEEASKGS